jgi:hypothetical protein
MDAQTAADQLTELLEAFPELATSRELERLERVELRAKLAGAYDDRMSIHELRLLVAIFT